MGNVRDNFLLPLVRQFILPKGAEDDIKAWESDYIRSLNGFSDETLRAASQNIMDIRTDRKFPLVGECHRACKETIEAMAIEKIKPEQKRSQRGYEAVENKYPEFSQYRIQAAYNMMKGSDLGRQAAEEYWIWGLHDFCREQQRLPEQHEIKRIKAKSKKVIEDLNACLCAPVTNPDYLSMRGALLNNWVASYAAKCKMIDVEVDPDTVMKIFQHKDDSNA